MSKTMIEEVEEFKKAVRKVGREIYKVFKKRETLYLVFVICYAILAILFMIYILIDLIKT